MHTKAEAAAREKQREEEARVAAELAAKEALAKQEAEKAAAAARLASQERSVIFSLVLGSIRVRLK